jgi:hypothetical protein
MLKKLDNEMSEDEKTDMEALFSRQYQAKKDLEKLDKEGRGLKKGVKKAFEAWSERRKATREMLQMKRKNKTNNLNLQPQTSPHPPTRATIR